MKVPFRALCAAAAIISLAGCAVVPPREIPETHENPIATPEKVGSSLGQMEYHCAMAAHQMAVGAALTNINYRVLAGGAHTIIEVDAVVHAGGFGIISAAIPSTLHCEYQGGRFTDLHWTRGLKR